MSDSGPDDDAAWAPRSPDPTPPDPPPVSESERSSEPALEPTPLVAGYRDFALIARGGDSLVYRAHDDALDREVAIKVVLLDDPESIARFRRELAITVRLGRQHPNILTVLATGTTADGQPCLVTDYVELGSLQHRLAERGRLPTSEVVAAGSVVADALAFAHAQGVLHRDVKPQNILVLPTSYLLADFGLARAIDAGHSASLERFSYRHASPQILDGEPPTVADDVYSLGSTLFTLLDGRAPFAADDRDEDSALSYLRRARTGTPRALPDDVSTELARIVGRCLARARTDRFPDAEQLRRALDSVPSESRSWAPGATVPPVTLPPVKPPVGQDPATPHGSATDAPPTDVTRTAPTPIGARPTEVDTAAVDTAAVDAAVVRPSTGDPAGVDLEPDVPPASVPARSALASLPQGDPTAAAVRDAEPTGLRPAAPDDADPGARSPDAATPMPEDSDARAPRPPRRWPLLVALAVVALVVGLVFGLRNGGNDGRGSSGTQGLSADPSTNPTGTATTTPTESRSVHVVPPASLTSIPPTTKISIDPSVRPKITTMRRKGSRLELTWTDPSKGRLPFIVFFAEPANARATLSADKGVTRASIPDFPGGRHCLLVSTVDTTPTTPVYGRGPVRCIDG